VLAPLSLERLVAPLDVARSALLRALGPSFARWLIDRERRANTFAATGTVTALALTLVAPLWLLALGPVLLGAAHLVADLRYLVLEPRLHRRRIACIAIGAPLMIGALTPFGPRAMALSIVGGALIARDARGLCAPRRLFATTLALGALAACWLAPRATEILIAHAHNFIAVLLWLVLWPRRGSGRWWVLAMFVAANAALVSGALDPLVHALSGFSRGPSALPLGAHMNALAPFPSHIEWSRRLVLSFAFSQSVHYALWLRVIPELARRSSTPRSFRQSVRGLESSLGPRLSLAVALGCVGLALWSSWDLVGAREGYLRFALFHGYLEIAVALLLFVERRSLSRSDASP
jgi:hypothetical protein